MALIKCKECGHDVSTIAKSCPICGAPPDQSSSEEKRVALIDYFDCSTWGRHATEYCFQYEMVDTQLIGSPEEKSETIDFSIKVGISEAMWNLDNDEVAKVLFEFGKREIIQKIRDGTIDRENEYWIFSNTHPNTCPYDPSRIELKEGVSFEVEIPDKYLMQNDKEIKIASSIVTTRDHINALFKDKYGDKLILLDQERNLMELFHAVKSEKEFSYAITALGNLVGNLNLNVLRRITEINDTSVKSISLLNEFIKRINGSECKLINDLRNLNRLRQGYPVHGDHLEGVIKAYKYFGLDYPVKSFNESWKILLSNYLSALKQLFEIILPSKG